jgi:hypothetical protein
MDSKSVRCLICVPFVAHKKCVLSLDYLKMIGCVGVKKDINARSVATGTLFQSTMDALREQGRIVLFPEGYGGAYPPLQPLKTGENGW